ncbi:MAG: winged helix-turn-helix domain-containing protein [Terracidiphilus sp.]|jgi:Tol biopolymer transport system component/DNA-binding winged helix-turn-helix (wHTH) protein
MRAFGPFQLDPRTGELTRKGIRVRLQPQQARLLTLLTSQPGRVYTREEIYNELWSNQAHGNFDQSLNFTVSQLRSALNDSAESSRFIETISKLGYRFVGSTQEIPARGSMPVSQPGSDAPELVEADGQVIGAASPLLSQTTAQIPPQKRIQSDAPAAARPAVRISSTWRSRWIQAALSMAVLAILAAAWWYLPLQPPRANGFAQITTADAIDFLVKPVMEGARIFYVERSGGHWIARQTSLEGGEPQTVPGLPENTRIMDLSPDRTTFLLGSFTSRGSTSALWLMPVQGGKPLRLGDITSGEAIWHPDGRRIVFARGNELWIVGTDAAGLKKFVSLPGTPNWLAWSPDGARMRLTIGDDHGKVSMWEMRQDGSNLHPMFAAGSSVEQQCCGEWTPDGRQFIFTGKNKDAWNLWAVREPGLSLRRYPRGPFQLTDWPGGLMGASVSPDGKSVLFYAGRNRSQIQRFDLTSKRLSPLSAEGFSQPEFSSDGRWMVYVDVNNGVFWKMDMLSSEKVELVPVGFSVSFPRWSPDGSMLAMTASDHGAAGTAYLISAAGGAPQPLLPGQPQVSDPDWAPNGKTLVAVHAIPGSEKESALFLVDLATRTEKMVPGSNGRFFPHWSPDGRYLAAYTDREKAVDIYNFATQKWQTIARGAAIGFPVWSGDSRFLYFQQVLEEGEPVFRINVRTGLAERVASFDVELSGGITRCALMGIAPDGALLVDTTRGNSDLFRAKLTLPK